MSYPQAESATPGRELLSVSLADYAQNNNKRLSSAISRLNDMSQRLSGPRPIAVKDDNAKVPQPTPSFHARMDSANRACGQMLDELETLIQNLENFV